MNFSARHADHMSMRAECVVQQATVPAAKLLHSADSASHDVALL